MKEKAQKLTQESPFVFRDVWTDQGLTPLEVSVMGSIDGAKLIQYLKHFKSLNGLLMNRLDRDDVQRGKDEGRFDAYSNILFTLTHTDLLKK